jgi:uncharacterized cupredoxin-like copper-binding protein
LAASALLLWPLEAGARKPAHSATKPKPSTVRVEAGKPSEFAYTVSPKTVPRGTVTFLVVNAGARAHDFTIAGKKTAILGPGGSAKLTVTFKKARGYVYFCTIAGHAVAGMKGVLKVT